MLKAGGDLLGLGPLWVRMGHVWVQEGHQDRAEGQGGHSGSSLGSRISSISTTTDQGMPWSLMALVQAGAGFKARPACPAESGGARSCSMTRDGPLTCLSLT